MYKCVKCGVEFDGNFCPNCGTKRQEKYFCSNCGVEVNVGQRFCVECGQALNEDDETPVTVVLQPERQDVGGGEMSTNRKYYGGVLSVLHKVVKYLPAGLFTLYTVLLFAFFAADVAYIPSIDLSFGTVYKEITQNISDMTGCVGALGFFTALSIVLSAVMWLSLLLKKLKGKVVGLFGKAYITLDELLNYISFALYFIFFIISIAMMSVVADFDEGMDFILSGAAPKLILSFAIIFAVFAGGALVGDWIISKKAPSITERDRQARSAGIAAKKLADEQKHLQKEQERQIAAENAAKVQANVTANDGGATVAPYMATETNADENAEQVSTEINTEHAPIIAGAQNNAYEFGDRKCLGGKPVYCKIKNYVKLSRALFGMGLTYLLSYLPFIAPIVLSQYGSRALPLYIAVYIFIAIQVVIVLACALAPVRHWIEKDLLKVKKSEYCKSRMERVHSIGFYIACLIALPIGYIIGVIINLALGVSFKSLVTLDFCWLPTALLIIIVHVFFVAGIIGCTILNSRRKELALYFYGEKKPTINTKAVVTLDLDKEIAFYNSYKKNKKVVAQCGNADVRTSKFIVRYSAQGVLALGIVIILTCFFAIFNPFSRNCISHIRMNDIDSYISDDQVRMLLGDPNEQIEGVMIYYDDDYEALNNKYYQLNYELEKALDTDVDRVEIIAKQIDNLCENNTYKCLTIISSTDSFGVYLDTKTRLDGKFSPKTVESVEISDSEILRGTVPTDTYCSYYYTDGSYKYERVPASAMQSLNFNGSNIQMMKWSDSWGVYETNVTLVDSVSGKVTIGDNDLRYTLTYDKKTGDIVMTLSGDVGGHVNTKVWDVYAPYVTRLKTDVKNNGKNNKNSYTVVGYVLEKFVALKSMIIVKNSDYVNIPKECVSLSDIWLEDEYPPMFWKIESPTTAVHSCSSWEYVDGVPTLKYSTGDSNDTSDSGGNGGTGGDKDIGNTGDNGDTSVNITYDDLYGTWSGAAIDDNGVETQFSLAFNYTGAFLLSAYRGGSNAQTLAGTYNITNGKLVLKRTDGVVLETTVLSNNQIRIKLSEDNKLLFTKDE